MRMKKMLVMITLVIAIVIAGCSGNNSNNTGTNAPKPTEGNSQNTNNEKPAEEKVEVVEPADQHDFKGRKIVIFDYNNSEGRAKGLETESGRRNAARIEALEKQFNVQVEFTDESHDALYASIVAGAPIADIMSGGGPHLYPVQIKGNLTLPLDDFGVFDFNDTTKWDTEVNKVVNFEGKHYGISQLNQAFGKVSNNQVLFFNKSLLQREGITDDLYELQRTGQWTWDKYFEIAAKITKDTDGDGVTDQWGIGDNQYQTYWSFVTSNDAAMIKVIDGKAQWSMGDANGLEVLNAYQDLAVNKKIMRVLQEGGQRDIDVQDFLAGKVGFIGEYLNRLFNAYPDMKDDYGVIMFPKGPKADDYRSELNWYGYWSIPTGVKNPEEVAIFMDAYFAPLFSEDEDEAALLESLETIVRDKESIETIQMLPSRTVSSSWFGYELNWGEGKWHEELTRIANGEKTPAAALQEVNDRFNQIIADTWK